jgi:hypothetical protein
VSTPAPGDGDTIKESPMANDEEEEESEVDSVIFDDENEENQDYT